MTAATSQGSLPSRRKNPYVGPRAFRRGETLPAREREKHELADLLVAERIVLLHAPSGAGKTSLIQAGLVPILDEARLHPSPTLRVKTPVPPNGLVHNRYLHSVALDLLGERHTSAELDGRSFTDVVAEAASEIDEGYLVLVLDQFEEILTLDPTDRENQTVFFKELGAALANLDIWALFSMREDFIGGLDRFIRYVPGHLAATYRLDFLDHSGAMLAIQRPAAAQGVTFTEDAAAALVRQLATVRVPRPGQQEVTVEGPYVEPFQLQVVCRKLWRAVKEAKPKDFRTIEAEDVALHLDVEAALRSYYADTVEDVAATTHADEKAIRRWFETALITPQGLRSQTLAGPESGDADSGEILRQLQEAYLVRSDTRGATWYELAHDQLVVPILQDNENWLRPHLAPWQLAANEWKDNRDTARLLSGYELKEAQRQANKTDLLPHERDFLQTSVRVERDQGPAERWKNAFSVVGAVAVFELFIILILVVALAAAS